MELILDDKLSATKEFVTELTEKGWQEIEHIQNQLANLDDTAESQLVKKLLNSLLTSYYIFVGGLENFETTDIDTKLSSDISDLSDSSINIEKPDSSLTPIETVQVAETEINEPFEYFIDFDEPIGEPLTDKDLYNN
jgi:hypothetical protein